MKASEEERDRWKGVAASAGLSFNAWARRALNEQADLDQADERERLKHTLERAEIVAKAKPQSKSSGVCKHEGYKGLPFCYRCGGRT